MNMNMNLGIGTESLCFDNKVLDSILQSKVGSKKNRHCLCQNHLK